MRFYHHSQLKFAKYYLVFLLLVFSNLGIAAGYHIVTNIGDYELSGRVDAAALAQADSRYAGCTILAHEQSEDYSVEVLVVQTPEGENHVAVLERFRPFQNYHLTYITDPRVPEGTLSSGGAMSYNQTNIAVDCYWSETPENDGMKTVDISVYESGFDLDVNINSVEGSFTYGKLTSAPFIILIVLVIVEAVVFFVIRKIRG